MPASYLLRAHNRAWRFITDVKLPEQTNVADRAKSCRQMKVLGIHGCHTHLGACLGAIHISCLVQAWQRVGVEACRLLQLGAASYGVF